MFGEKEPGWQINQRLGGVEADAKRPGVQTQPSHLN